MDFLLHPSIYHFSTYVMSPTASCLVATQWTPWFIACSSSNYCTLLIWDPVACCFCLIPTQPLPVYPVTPRQMFPCLSALVMYLACLSNQTQSPSMMVTPTILCHLLWICPLYFVVTSNLPFHCYWPLTKLWTCCTLQLPPIPDHYNIYSIKFLS